MVKHGYIKGKPATVSDKMAQKLLKEAGNMAAPVNMVWNYQIIEKSEYDFKKHKANVYYIIQVYETFKEMRIVKKFFFFSTLEWVPVEKWATVQEGEYFTSKPRRFKKKEHAQKYINYLKKYGKA